MPVPTSPTRPSQFSPSVSPPSAILRHQLPPLHNSNHPPSPSPPPGLRIPYQQNGYDHLLPPRLSLRGPIPQNGPRLGNLGPRMLLNGPRNINPPLPPQGQQ